MRLIYLHQYFNTPSMSGGTRSFEMARRLVDAGHEVQMVTSDRNGRGKAYRSVEAGIHVTWIPVRYSNSMNFSDRIRAFFEFAWKSARIATRLEGDLVLASSTPLTIAIPGVYASKQKRIPMVFEVRDLWPEMPIAMGALRNPVSRYLARRLERFAYQNADWIIALSPGMKNGVVSSGYPEDRVTVIPNSCDIELFAVGDGARRSFRESFDWLGDRPLVVYVGTLGLVNGVGYLAHLAKEVLRKDPEVRFLVVGQGKEEAQIRNTAQQLGVLNRNFFMIPNVAKNEVPTILAAADLATSLFIDVAEMEANSANKFFDAIAAGRPVAINYGGWQEELLKSTGAGIRLDSRNIGRAAEVLLTFISDRCRMENASHAARLLATNRFNRDKLAKDFEQVLLNVLR